MAGCYTREYRARPRSAGSRKCPGTVAKRRATVSFLCRLVRCSPRVDERPARYAQYSAKLRELFRGGGFTDPRRKPCDLRERQGQKPFGHALDMITLLAQALFAL